MGKLDRINPNNWNEVISFCKSEGIKPSEVFKLASKKLINKTDPRTISIGILVHDKLELNKKRKNPLSTRAIILNLAKEIRKLSGKELPSAEQVYGVGHKALKRTPWVLLHDKDVRKIFEEGALAHQ